MAPSQPRAEDGVAGTQAEEGEPAGEKDDVEHGASVSVGRTGRSLAPFPGRSEVSAGTALGFERARRAPL